jgi:hypothetical protein
MAFLCGLYLTIAKIRYFDTSCFIFIKLSISHRMLMQFCIWENR